MADPSTDKHSNDVAGWAAWMKAEREARGWSTTQLARYAREVARAEGSAIALTQQTVSGFEQPGEAKRVPEWMRFIRIAFEGPTAKHRTTTKPKRTPQIESDQQPTNSASADDGAIDIRQVDLSYSMGDGTTIEDYPDEVAVKFDPNLLRILTRTPPEKLFVATGAGESMQPTLLDNDTVLIDTNQRKLNMLDRIWAVSVHGSGATKRLRAIGKDRVLVISDNPAVPPQEVGADDLFIVGRVIWVGRRV